MGHSVDNYAFNTESIRLQQRAHQTFHLAKLKEEFEGDSSLVVHWDGKLMQDLTGQKEVDSLPVLVSRKPVSQVLFVAKLPSGTGQAQASAVFEVLKNLDVVIRLNATCFDTTSSNTGRSI